MDSSPDSENPSEFDYSGWLLFYPFRTTVKGDFARHQPADLVEDTLRERLPKYDRGTPESPGNGFRIEDTRGLMQQVGLLSEFPPLKDTIHMEYVREKYEKMLVYDEEGDDFEEKNAVNISTTDIFWRYPSHLLVRGSRTDTEIIKSRVRSILVDSLHLEKISFDMDFFVWLIYQSDLDQAISDDISLIQIQSVKFADSSASWEDEIEPTNRDGSLGPSVFPLLEGKQVVGVEIMFQYQNESVVAEITNERVQILVSKGSPNDMMAIEKIGLSVAFVSDFVDIYDHWKMLPAERRYPPEDFFKRLYQTAVNEGYETKGISRDLIERYRSYREGE